MSDLQKVFSVLCFAVFVVVAMQWIYSEYSMGHRVMEFSKQAVIYCGENNVKAVTLEGFECERDPAPADPPK